MPELEDFATLSFGFNTMHLTLLPRLRTTKESGSWIERKTWTGSLRGWVESSTIKLR